MPLQGDQLWITHQPDTAVKRHLNGIGERNIFLGEMMFPAGFFRLIVCDLQMKVT